MTIDNGGPAFPTANNLGVGMSLRDWMAAKAMIALLPIVDAQIKILMKKPSDSEVRVAIAKESYNLADAMIAARKKERP